MSYIKPNDVPLIRWMYIIYQWNENDSFEVYWRTMTEGA